MAEDPTRPSAETRAEEQQEARREHVADRPPTAEEERRADELELDPDVVEHAHEMTERGAKQQGEGRIP
jgi:hypothetical protein